MSDIKSYLPTDIGAGELFEDTYAGQVLYCTLQNRWFIWNGTYWAEDTTEQINELAKALVAKTMPSIASTIADDTQRIGWLGWAKKMQSNYNRNQMLISARSRPSIAEKIETFDYNTQFINMRNGELNLKTGELSPHNKYNYMTKITGAHYNLDAKCERWEKFVLEVMDGNEEAAHFLQKAVGYALAGEPLDDCLFILYGEKTRNGKTTFCRAILNALGDYGSTARPETLAINRNRTGSGPNSDIARLRGARFVNMPEPGKGMELDGSLVKSLTGRDPILARYMHREFFEFIPQFVLFLNTNYLPRIDDMTLFSSGRIFCIPFPVHFTANKQDAHLLEQFMTVEATSAIFNWIYEGYNMYRWEGIKNNVPEAISAATKEYNNNSDTFGQFIQEHIVNIDNTFTETKEIYHIYEQWAKDNGYFALSIKNMSSELKQRGYTPKLHPKTRRAGFCDITLEKYLPEDWRR